MCFFPIRLWFPNCQLVISLGLCINFCSIQSLFMSLLPLPKFLSRACARRAHQSTRRSTRPVLWPAANVVIVSFDFRSLSYLPDEFKKLFQCLFISSIFSLPTIDGWDLGRTNSLTLARGGDSLRYIRIWATPLRMLVF